MQEVEQCSFIPLVFTNTGGVAADCNRYHSRLAKEEERIIAGLPRARSARGTEPYTHEIWSTSFRLVVT